METTTRWLCVPTGEAAQTWASTRTPGPTFLDQSAELGSTRLSLCSWQLSSTFVQNAAGGHQGWLPLTSRGPSRAVSFCIQTRTAC